VRSSEYLLKGIGILGDALHPLSDDRANKHQSSLESDSIAAPKPGGARKAIISTA
jgi:hypothetical protein